MMDGKYTQLILFYYVAHYMSFTKAAKYLQCSKAYISRQITDFEHSIGTTLLYRNTRKIELTLAGEAIFAHAEVIVHEFHHTEHTISSLQDKASGVLRLTSPSAYAESILAPNLPKFLKEYPQIRVEMNLTGELLDLLEKKIDVAIRLTHEPPIDRVAKRMGEYQMILCASPEYLQEFGEPSIPIELIDHECLVYSTEKNYNSWPFMVDDKRITVDVQSKIIANQNSILLKAAIEGLGIARLPDYVVQNAIQNGQLQVILSHYYPVAIPIYAIYFQSRVIPTKIRVFLKFLQEIHKNALEIS